MARAGFINLRYGPLAGSCEHSNKLSGVVKFGVLGEALSFRRKARLHGVSFIQQGLFSYTCYFVDKQDNFNLWLT